MKILLSFLLIFISVFNSFGSPLVFKVAKDIDSKSEFVELGVFDATKYKQIRIRITLKPEPLDIGSYEFAILGVESGDEFLISSRASEVIDSPPSKIKIKVRGQGKFSLYVWAE